MSLVLDASVAAARSFADEITPAVLQVFRQIDAGGAWVPSLWKLEIANVLELAVRKGLREMAERNQALLTLGDLPIKVDPQTARHAWGETLNLARKHRLTTYDAAYLELALRRSLPLASLDRDLRTAASAEGIQLLGL